MVLRLGSKELGCLFVRSMDGLRILIFIRLAIACGEDQRYSGVGHMERRCM